MAFVKGQSGNPLGRQAEKPWRDAIMIAIKRRAEGKDSPQALTRLAEAVVAAGLAGDMTAIKEIGDRLDGKPAQSVSVSGEEGGAPIKTSLEVMFVNPPAVED
jgi:hypothetical protein